MRSMIRILMLASIAASATAAFASDTIIVNVPFSFETHGKAFPAGKYEVEFYPRAYALRFSSQTDTSKSIMWAAVPADYTPEMAKLALKFDREADGTHALRSIRLETWETPVLDKREKLVAQPEVSITGGR